ncbi:MAG: efflux RND transporter permease subunit [Myxococcota bacterium]
MNRLIAWFAANRVAANLLMLFIVAAGLLSIPRLRQETMPHVAFDVISIGVEYPGAAPDEIERAICVRIEEAIHGLRGIDRLSSRASEGFGVVWAQLDVGADARRVTEEIKTRVEALETLPVEAEKPIIQELLDDSVLIAVAVYGDANYATLHQLGERVRDEITSLAAVTRAELVGVRPYEVAIEVSEADLRRYGLSFDDISAAVRASSVDLPGGSLKTRTGEILIRTRAGVDRGPEFESIVLRTSDDGSRLYLGDVARVVDGFAEGDEKIRLDGKPAVVVRLLTSEKENVLDVTRAVRGYVAASRSRMPEGVGIAIWLDQSREFEGRRDLLLRNGGQGLVLILLVLALFLRPRLAVWVAAGIPIAFLGALLVLVWVGVSINMMSLFAFIVALGLIVDDAIILGENVDRHRRLGKNGVDAAIAGATEVAVPVTVAVLTTILFVLPTLSLPTIPGKFSYSLGVVVIACLAFSVVEALLVLPAHLVHKTSPGPARTPKGVIGFLDRHQRRFDARVDGFIAGPYRRFLEAALRRPGVALAIACASLMLALGSLSGGWVKYAFFPDIEYDSVTARLVMPEGTAPEVMEASMAHIEAQALALEAELREEDRGDGGSVVEHVLVAIGDAPYRHDDMKGGGEGPNVGYVAIGLVPGEDRTVTSLEIEERWRERVGPIPGAWSLAFSGTDVGAGSLIDVSLWGPDRELLKRAVEALEAELVAIPGVREVTDSLRGGKPELELGVRPEGEAMGLTLSELARQVRQGFHGEEVRRIQRGRDDVKVVVRYPPQERRSIGDLESVRIRIPGGGEFPFSVVAVAELRRGASPIDRRDRKSEIAVSADIDTRVVTQNEVKTLITEAAMPRILAAYPGVEYGLLGTSREESELSEYLYRSWLLALFAAYAVLATCLRSYLQPILILSAIPFGFVGAVIGHALLGLQLSSFSMIGMLALTGVVINDALVLLDRANRNRAEGLEWGAAMLEAGSTRFRAIVLTSLTTFFGLLPLLFERSAQAAWLKPMAVTLAFGVVFATVITLVLIPAAWIWMQSGMEWARNLAMVSRVSKPAAMPIPDSAFDSAQESM